MFGLLGVLGFTFLAWLVLRMLPDEIELRDRDRR